MREFLKPFFEWLTEQPLFVPAILVVTVFAGIYLWKRADIITAKAKKDEVANERSKITHDDAEVLQDWVGDLEERVTLLESQPANVTARLEVGANIGQAPQLILRNRSTRTNVGDLDARVIARDGQQCPPVRVTQGGSLQLAAGALERLAWPDKAGAAHSYVLLLTWREGDRLVDQEFVVWHPTA